MSKKFLVTIVLILFLLPFVSWYYLQSGLDWRKDAQAVMNGTNPFPSGACVLADGRISRQKIILLVDLVKAIEIISLVKQKNI